MSLYIPKWHIPSPVSTVVTSSVTEGRRPVNSPMLCLWQGQGHVQKYLLLQVGTAYVLLLPCYISGFVTYFPPEEHASPCPALPPTCIAPSGPLYFPLLAAQRAASFKGKAREGAWEFEHVAGK